MKKSLQFAGLAPDQQLETLTFEEAMDLFKLPKDLGEYEGEPVEVNNGRFGPYVKFGEKYISLPKGKKSARCGARRSHCLY